MDINNQKYNEEIFPNLAPYERAICYPYFAPDYSFSFYKGQFVKGICDDLSNRIPILSVGSNRSPYQLKRKFSLEQDICVTPATLHDSDIVYAASLSSYGSMPATQWPSEGTKVDLNVLWLKEEQLNIMHLTEALGVAYNFVKLKLGTVKIKDFVYRKSIYGYVSIPGAFPFKQKIPKRLSALKARNSKLADLSEINALIRLKDYLEVNDKNLSEWIRKVINNMSYRLNVHKILKSKAVQPKDYNWEIVETDVKGKLII
tara:strand:- start:82 stop:858 length:777 start_codon:yes stop_codon:yes gene_type:complete